jgi:hypothetical protein
MGGCVKTKVDTPDPLTSDAKKGGFVAQSRQYLEYYFYTQKLSLSGDCRPKHKHKLLSLPSLVYNSLIPYRE